MQVIGDLDISGTVGGFASHSNYCIRDSKQRSILSINVPAQTIWVEDDLSLRYCEPEEARSLVLLAIQRGYILPYASRPNTPMLNASK